MSHYVLIYFPMRHQNIVVNRGEAQRTSAALILTSHHVILCSHTQRRINEHTASSLRFTRVARQSTTSTP